LGFIFLQPFTALNSLQCAGMQLRNYSLTHDGQVLNIFISSAGDREIQRKVKQQQ